MASHLSRRLTSAFIQQNPRNPSSISSIFHANAHFRTLAEPKPTSPPPIATDPFSCHPKPSVFFDPCLLRSHSISTTTPQTINSNPNPRNPNPNNPFKFVNISFTSRHFSSTPPENADQDQTPEFRHQEIVGPTVERDVSALADETRKSLESMRKSIYDLSSALAMLGFANLGLGAWIAYAVKPPQEVMIQGVAAFGFPFAVAFLMRRTLKPISFFRKMEEQGRLQILTLSLQVSKTMNLLFLRMRVVSICCVVGISAGSFVALLSR